MWLRLELQKVMHLFQRASAYPRAEQVGCQRDWMEHRQGLPLQTVNLQTARQYLRAAVTPEDH